jgi:hypothetical protein
MPADESHGGGLLMGTPEISSDRKIFAFLVGIAALGLSLAVGSKLVLASLGPSAAPLPETSIFDPDLRGAMANYPDAVNEVRATFTAATPQGTRTVTNCADYLKLLDQGVRSPVVDPTDAHNAYGNCPLLFLLRQAREPATYLAPLSQLARTVAERLDARTLDDSLRPFPVSDRPGGKPARSRFIVDEERLRISSPDGAWSMTILASGSFSGNGMEDVAVRIERGKTRHYTILTLMPSGSLAAVSPESLAMTTNIPVRLR